MPNGEAVVCEATYSGFDTRQAPNIRRTMRELLGEETRTVEKTVAIYGPLTCDLCGYHEDESYIFEIKSRGRR